MNTVRTAFVETLLIIFLINQICCFFSPEKVIDWVLPYHHYQDQLVDQAALMLTLSGRVNETLQVLASQTSFRLRTPDIHIEVRKTHNTNC